MLGLMPGTWRGYLEQVSFFPWFGHGSPETGLKGEHRGSLKDTVRSLPAWALLFPTCSHSICWQCQVLLPVCHLSRQ